MLELVIVDIHSEIASDNNSSQELLIKSNFTYYR